MDERVVRFISALRAKGLRISLAESADAFQAVDQLGVQNRELFRTSLRTTLVKESRDMAEFDQLFELFFQPAPPPPMIDATQDLTPEEAKMLADALQRFNKSLREMMRKLLNGDPLSPEELKQADDLVNMDNARDLRYQNWLARQMEQMLKFRNVREAMVELLRLLDQMGMNRQRVEQIRERIRANQQAMQEQLRQHSGERILENMSEQGPHPPEPGLLERPFQSFDESDLAQLRHEVTRLAASLRSRLALRFKRARSGRLDLKATLRANLKNGSVPIELHHRDHTLKPKLVVICDISTSMRYCSELMLSLVYAIQDQISKTHAFTFIDHLEDVSADFDHNPPAQAIEQVLQRMPPGHYNTDLGYSLVQFNEKYLDTVDHRTTLIVLGDGRNNYRDPHTEILKEITRRARATIWLNPEPIPLWGTGDSDMPRYAPLCDRTFQVGNLRQLAEAIDNLLLH